MTKILRRALVVVLFVASGATSAHAESAQARAACTPSVFQLCPGAAFSGNREMARACLLRNLARASARCQAAVKATPPERSDERGEAPRLREALR